MKVVQLAPVSFAYELFEGVRSHASAPQHGRILVNEKSYGEHLHAVAFGGNYELASVNLVHI